MNKPVAMLFAVFTAVSNPVLALADEVSVTHTTEVSVRKFEVSLKRKSEYSVALYNLPKDTILSSQNIRPVEVRAKSQMPPEAIAGSEFLYGCKLYAPVAKAGVITDAVVNSPSTGAGFREPLFSQYIRAAMKCIDEKRADLASKYQWGAITELEKMVRNGAKLQDYSTNRSLGDLIYLESNISDIRDEQPTTHNRTQAQKELIASGQSLQFHQRLHSALMRLLPPDNKYVKCCADYVAMDKSDVESATELLKAYENGTVIQK